MVGMIARDFLKQTAANNLVTFFLRGRQPGRLNTAECLLKTGKGFLSTFAANFDL